MIIKLILVAIVLMALAFAGLALQIMFKKYGKFPDTHISQNKHMKAKGITCVKTFDRMEQAKYNPNRFKGMRLAK